MFRRDGELRAAGPGEEARRAPASDRVPALPGAVVAEPGEARGEPLPGHRRGLELEHHPAVGRPVRRRLVEGDRDLRPRAPRDDAGRRVGPGLAPERHRHEAARADAPAGEGAPAAREGDERAAGERALLDRLDLGEREPPRLALGQREPPARLREARPLLLALGGEQRGQPVEVVREVQAHRYIPAAR